MEGGLNDSFENNTVKTLHTVYEEILTTKDKLYFFSLAQFIIGNALLQIMYHLYNMKVGINTDYYKCVVVGYNTKPEDYGDWDGYKQIMKNLKAVDVTEKFDQAYQYGEITWFLFDVYILITFYQIYKSK